MHESTRTSDVPVGQQQQLQAAATEQLWWWQPWRRGTKSWRRCRTTNKTVNQQHRLSRPHVHKYATITTSNFATHRDIKVAKAHVSTGFNRFTCSVMIQLGTTLIRYNAEKNQHVYQRKNAKNAAPVRLFSVHTSKEQNDPWNYRQE